MINTYVPFKCYKILQLKSVNLEVTQKCNSRCISCQIWKMPNILFNKMETTEKELKYEDHVRIVTELSQLGCKELELHGGEPTLYPELPELIAHCSSLGMFTYFFTNGLSMTHSLAEKVVQAGLKRINFSLDGPKECHTALRGREDAFNKQIEAIKYVTEADAEKKVLKNIGTMVSSVNLERIDEVIDIAAKYGINMVTYTFHSLINEQIVNETNNIFGESVASYRTVITDDLLPKDLKLLEQKRLEIKEKARKLGIRVVRTRFMTIPAEDIAKGIKRYRYPCESFYENCTIDAFGNVIPCEMMRFKLGNVKYMPIKDIFNNGRFEQFTKSYTENFNDLRICDFCGDSL